MTNEKLKETVKNLLLSNIDEGHSKHLKSNYYYIQPSPGTYPFQFFWDTCFHVIMLTNLGETDIAKKSFKSLFSAQEENGFVGHKIFWNKTLPTTWSDVFQARSTLSRPRPYMSALIQPPLVAQALKKIYDKTYDKAYLSEMVPKLTKYFDWLEKNRDFEKKGLISIISPFESGMDWSPVFDPVVGHTGKANWKLYLKVIGVDFRNFIYRYNLKKIYKANYFIVKDVVFNTMYGLDLMALHKLCLIIGDTNADKFKKRYKMVVSGIKEVMYDAQDKAFYNVYGRENKKAKILTPSIFLPLVFKGTISDSTAHAIYTAHLLNKNELWTKFPVPSVSKNHSLFDPTESKYIWRGPTWAVFNWLLYHCLTTRGYIKHAVRIRNSTISLIEKSGFREYYNPFTGEGYGAKNFTWSGLVVDMMKD